MTLKSEGNICIDAEPRPVDAQTRALRLVLVQLGVEAEARPPAFAEASPVAWLDAIDREIEQASLASDGFRRLGAVDHAVREALIRIGALALRGLAALDDAGGAEAGR